jgi:hypothetical protein
VARIYDEQRSWDKVQKKGGRKAPSPKPPVSSGLELQATYCERATLDFPNTPAQQGSDLTIAVTGAAIGDVVSLGIPASSVNNHSGYHAWVSAANVVTVRFDNYSSGAIDPASGVFTVEVRHYG